MKKDTIIALLYEKYICPTERKHGKYSGIEIEMPAYILPELALEYGALSC